jgi:hypothetical protein
MCVEVLELLVNCTAGGAGRVGESGRTQSMHAYTLAVYESLVSIWGAHNVNVLRSVEL